VGRFENSGSVVTGTPAKGVSAAKRLAAQRLVFWTLSQGACPHAGSREYRHRSFRLPDHPRGSLRPEADWTLSRLIKKTSTVLSPVFSVRGRGRDLFAAVERLDLEGIVAKWVAGPYTPDTVWRKVRNGAYTQMEGRRELFHPR
jgi:hypothetical protein